MQVRFWGTRGSIATPGPGTIQFGGNTACVEATLASGRRVIFDCGTGARPLGNELMANGPRPCRAAILISHTHWDHIQGFPFFTPAFARGNEFDIYGPEGSLRSLREALCGQMQYSYFPIEIEQLPARLSFHDLSEGLHWVHGIKITAHFMNHPAMTLGYRIEADGVSLVYLCDHEPFSEKLWRADAEPGQLQSVLHEGDRRHGEFMKGADLVIHDAMYTPEQYAAKRNWGHSTYEYAVGLAAAAGVRNLALTHHDPAHDDDFILEIEARARREAEQYSRNLEVFCAREGAELNLGTQTSSQTAPTASSLFKILVVDDDPDIIRLAQKALAHADYAVRVASNGSDALVEVGRSLPDLIVLDLVMPQTSGLDMLRSLRSNPATQGVPVLILTSNDDEGSVQTAFEIGATDYVTKPFSLPQLATRVRACLLRAHQEGT
jgi:phosphoribosyl 1,2-cyclic phosphodiesterase/ActR/RegA family two-component response regulator